MLVTGTRKKALGGYASEVRYTTGRDITAFQRENANPCGGNLA